MIVVVDYGSGNLRSVAKALESAGASVVVSGDPATARRADRLVLPGVGAFGDCRRNLDAAGLTEPILEHLQAGRPFLGICVGMQLLFAEGLEFGRHPGLHVIPGQVVPFDKAMGDPADGARHLKVPHMGWNRVRQTQEHPLWNGIPDQSHFYFVHSFHGRPEEPAVVAGESDYGLPFAAAVARDNLFGAQFHPEKSQRRGLQLLANFIGWRP
ncbi:MAG: imidazole glycerol phosphate synthase subunit HisH [Magnetococcales bacterium]|nr:imidazole glycerol phosphate synthase subunit HisH [Magnetococcales bacterium]